MKAKIFSNDGCFNTKKFIYTKILGRDQFCNSFNLFQAHVSFMIHTTFLQIFKGKKGFQFLFCGFFPFNGEVSSFSKQLSFMHKLA